MESVRLALITGGRVETETTAVVSLETKVGGNGMQLYISVIVIGFVTAHDNWVYSNLLAIMWYFPALVKNF